MCASHFRAPLSQCRSPSSPSPVYPLSIHLLSPFTAHPTCCQCPQPSHHCLPTLHMEGKLRHRKGSDLHQDTWQLQSRAKGRTQVSGLLPAGMASSAQTAGVLRALLIVASLSCPRGRAACRGTCASCPDQKLRISGEGKGGRGLDTPLGRSSHHHTTRPLTFPARVMTAK